MHHLVSFICYASALFGGTHMVLLTHIAMVCEFSQIFLNLRNTLGKHITGLIPLVNNLIFFATYTVLRVILFPWLILIHFKASKHYDVWNTGKLGTLNTADGSDRVPTSRVHQVCWIVVVSFFFGVYLLNLRWYTFIVRALIKVIKGDTTAGGKEEKIIGDKR